MRTITLKIVVIALFAACAGNGQTTGSVAGTVLENGSLPIPGATVTYFALGHLVKDSRGRSQYISSKIGGSLQSHTDGTFNIVGLPAGTYVICARGTLPIHISSCAWDGSNPQVSIAAGQSLTGLRLNVRRGALLDIAIHDSAGCVGKNSKAPVYIFVNSRPQQALRGSATSSGYHYQALVPQQVPVKVSASHPCNVADSNGNTISGAGLTIPAIQGETASVTITAK